MFAKKVKQVAGALVSAVTLSLLVSQPAHAVFTVPAEIGEAATNVGLVGAAVFTVMVGIKLYKWLRRAL